MFLAGGGPLSLAEIVLAYDAVNRDVLPVKNMESALNRLLCAGLIASKEDRFSIPRSMGLAFETFRQRLKKCRFITADRFLKAYEPSGKVPRNVRLNEASYQHAIAEYHRVFREAQRAG